MSLTRDFTLVSFATRIAEEAREAHGRGVALALSLTLAGLWCYSLTRAATLSFTHDECLSYTIVSEFSTWWKDTNNHVLNTLLMKLSQLVFGDGEFPLRLPNSLAHGVFLVTSYLCLHRLRSPLLVIAGFLILNTNPFVLDFFSLARGYGLSLALMMISLFSFLEAIRSGPTGSDRLFAISFIASGLGIWASYGLLNFHLALVGTVFIQQLQLYRVSEDSRQRHMIRRRGLRLVGLNAVIVGSVLPVLIWLKIHDRFWFGGVGSFTSDTLRPLVVRSLYAWEPTSLADPLTSLICILFGLLVCYAIWRIIFQKKSSAAGFLVLMLCICLASIISQYFILKTPYPVARASLFFVPIFLLAIILTVAELGTLLSQKENRIALTLLVTLCGALVWNFLASASLSTTYLWRYDANTREAMEALERDHTTDLTARDHVTLGVWWHFEPSTNYYRTTRDMTWLAPTQRKEEPAEGFDYYYMPKKQQDEYGPELGLEVIATYLPSKSVLSKPAR